MIVLPPVVVVVFRAKAAATSVVAPAPDPAWPAKITSVKSPHLTGPSSLPVAFRTTLLAVWILGAGLVIVSIIHALWRTRWLRLTAVPWADGAQLVVDLQPSGDVGRHIEVLHGERIAVPMTCGALRPAILMPADVAQWGLTDVRQALIHELEHVRRGDWLMLITARVVCAVYWFHPLVWLAWRRLRLEVERACDDAVLRTAERTVYAEQLVALARREFEQDREVASRQAVVGPEPSNGWEAFQPDFLSYAREARDTTRTGVVAVEGQIGADGFVSGLRASSTDPVLSAMTAAAFEDTFWKPARVRGVAVEVPLRFTVRYVRDTPEP